MANRLADTRRFYELLGRLQNRVGGPRRLVDCTGRMDWPRRGLYFFCEAGEERSGSGVGLRVVRIEPYALSKQLQENRCVQFTYPRTLAFDPTRMDTVREPQLLHPVTTDRSVAVTGEPVTPPTLFISYSHKDARLLDEFKAHLSPLKEAGTIATWDDQELIVGDKLEESLQSHLESADMVAFLLSSDFLHSFSCYQKELLEILARRCYKHVEVLPIILRDCLWRHTPIADFVAVPTDGKAVTSLSDRDAAWVNVAQQIKARADRWRELAPKNAGSKRPSISHHDVRGSFEIWLEDTEVPFTHKMKEDHLTLPDIYVYPDLRGVRKKSTDTVETVNGSELLNRDSIGPEILIHGDEQSGKTALLKMLYSHYMKAGIRPLYLDAKDITTSDQDKALGKLVIQQYEHVGWKEYQTMQNARMLLVDNYDALPLNAKFERQFLSSVRQTFDYLVLVADSELTFDEKRMVELASLPRWELLPFGHVRRGELIERWNSIGEEETIDAATLYQRNDETTRSLNTVIRKNLLPPRPIFVLTVLQLLESVMPTNFELSSYGHCYQALILQALHKVGIRSQDFDPFVNYLSEFAYFCFTRRSEALDGNQFELFKEDYSSKFIIQSHEEVVSKLQQAEILRGHRGGFRFSYRYIFYFYTAKYLSDHLDEVNDDIEGICENMHTERNANVLIFLMHHSRDQRVIDEVLLRAEMIYDGENPASLVKAETQHLMDLAQTVPDLVIEQVDVERERKRVLERRDVHDNEIEDDFDDAGEFDQELADIVRSARMVDVIGQVLRNRSGSLQKSQLLELARAGYASGLKFLSFWLGLTKVAEAYFVGNIARALADKVDRGEDVEKIRRAAGREYFRLCYAVCYGVIRRITGSIGAKELVQIFDAIEEEEPDSVAVRMINVAIRMEFTKKIPRDRINSLDAELGGNPVARMLLREVVVHHLYLNDVGVADKQWISSKLGIPMKSQRLLESKRALKR